MFRSIEEIRVGNNRIFRVRKFNSDGSQIKSFETYFISKHLKRDGFTYYFLFNKDGKLVEEVYNYVNFYMQSYSPNYRNQLNISIKQLYDYASCIEKPIQMFEYEDFVGYQHFLRGYADKVYSDSLYMSTIKSTVSIRLNLFAIKQYLEINGYDNEKYLKRICDKVDGGRKKSNIDCPMFITYAQMLDIHEYIENDDTLTDIQKKCYLALYDIQYFSGLRIGEALGLTIQDLVMTYDDEGEPIYKAIIRNRVSDSPRQSAKRVMNVYDKKTYKSREYKSKKGIGSQEVMLTEDVYNELIDYFDACYSYFKKKKQTPAVADNVHDDGNDNFYIFNNKVSNTPLSYSTLKAYTRKMFKDLGLHVDEYSREHNLLHRFRHGFCMYLLFVKKLPVEQVLIYSRHASIKSLQPYMNPTDEMLRDLYKKIWEEDNECQVDQL